ncbi:MAG TPA: nucleotidyltransferase domain-containing protein [bacterium]|nr:nucleotidyltransferase domain-containing protein [bacterium]
MAEITPRERALIADLLAAHLPGVPIHAFGSRVNGNAKPYSDLDIALITDTPLPIAQVAELAEAFAETDLPFRVDIVEWARIADDFKAVIAARYEKLQ